MILDDANSYQETSDELLPVEVTMIMQPWLMNLASTIVVPMAMFTQGLSTHRSVVSVPSKAADRAKFVDCGMSIATGANPAPASDCSSACTGNASEPCGGSSRLNLFWSGTTGPQTNPGPGAWKFAGCYAWVPFKVFIQIFKRWYALEVVEMIGASIFEYRCFLIWA